MARKTTPKPDPVEDFDDGFDEDTVDDEYAEDAPADDADEYGDAQTEDAGTEQTENTPIGVPKLRVTPKHEVYSDWLGTTYGVAISPVVVATVLTREPVFMAGGGKEAVEAAKAKKKADEEAAKLYRKENGPKIRAEKKAAKLREELAKLEALYGDGDTPDDDEIDIVDDDGDDF